MPQQDNLFNIEIYELLIAQRKDKAHIGDFIYALNLKCIAQNATHLDLSNKKLLSIDIQHLCMALKANSFLKTLDLSGNSIESDSAEKIIDLFCDNNTLEVIHFSDPKMDRQKRKDIETFLETNRNKNASQRKKYLA